MHPIMVSIISPEPNDVPAINPTATKNNGRAQLKDAIP